MRGRLIGVIVFAVAGFAVLVALGTWQVRRLHWKEGVLAQIEGRIAAAPVALPDAPDPEADKYLAVALKGQFAGPVLRIQSAQEGYGAGYHLVQGFASGTRRVMVDRGFIPQGAPIPAAPAAETEISGNLLWPDEKDSFTPDPDLATGLFYARDVPEMAAVLNTEPVLVVRRDAAGQAGALMLAPVGTDGIPNDHKGYAITWFALAAIWLVMSGGLIYRMGKQGKGELA
ncbi:SURF1 family protein [Pseudooceanicola sediminis]|uniref:SURF1-like protein n=1 Tax=Pseudooceanicola sediminis TaxID=2211117 RepID=A0A399J3R4_9RHOB|nr:SURF1 family protein [Pseudooceanicola sediminis]KAA2311525.1 SURF1 family protein [Puniceibacterium sp. HSS470]RII40033.1 SURF1 family protein [Pseudooceanicola sediminis]|tara:strand:+ start:101287 stop:101973 length:687 start_codon:yes stop_codon:yes gene_type:complete